MSDIQELTKKVITFRDKRDWKQFHNPKDLALSITLEAAEILEHFQWKSKEEIEEYVKTQKKDISDEIADVIKYILMMCHDLDIDITAAVLSKMKEDEKKYPVEKVRGSHKKYTEY